LRPFCGLNGTVISEMGYDGQARLNRFSRSRRLNTTAVGRPCGQWWASSAKSRWANSSPNSASVSRSPARGAAGRQVAEELVPVGQAVLLGEVFGHAPQERARRLPAQRRRVAGQEDRPAAEPLDPQTQVRQRVPMFEQDRGWVRTS
jgi:hypothetical protein